MLENCSCIGEKLLSCFNASSIIRRNLDHVAYFLVLQLVFGTLPLLLVVWVVDKFMNDTFSSTIVWGVGGVMILFALLQGMF